MYMQQRIMKRIVPILAVLLCVLLVSGGCTQASNRVYQVSNSPPALASDHSSAGWRGSPVVDKWSTSRSDAKGPSEQEWSSPQQFASSAAQTAAERAMSAEALKVYHIGPGDRLMVKIFQLTQLDREDVLNVEVDGHGGIYLPLLNHVQVAGMTAEGVQKDLVTRLGSEFIRAPKVNVSVTRYGSKHVMVEGYVGRPGLIPLDTDETTLLQVIAKAGGIRQNAAPNIEVVRGGMQNDFALDMKQTHRNRLWVPVVKLYAPAGEQVNPVIRPGDLVRAYAGSEGVVYMSGEVKNQGPKTYRRSMNIMQAVTVAGGVTNIAKQNKVKVIRTTPEGEEKVIIVDLVKIRKGQQPNLILAQNDMIIVPVDPVAKFFDDAFSLLQASVRTGVDMTYNAAADVGITGSGAVVP